MRYITTVKLKKEHDIYTNGENFILKSPIGKSGEISERIVEIEKVKIFLDLFRGKRITIEEAIDIIKSYEYEKYLNTYDWKQQFEVRNILLCIVVQGYGRFEKCGRKYIFEIYG